MKDITLQFERRAGEQGLLFGSVTSMDIADALKAKGYEIDRRKIVLKEAIKETGEFTVPVKLHREVTLQVPVTVTAEGAAEEAAKAKKNTQETTETAAESTEA
jgi:large subunit ribosomal protein L9